MSATRWYLAGQMSGVPQFNFPRFDYAAALLRSKGYDVVSPAELDDKADRMSALKSPDGIPSPGDKSWGVFLARDVKIVADEVDGVILLDDWVRSRGARLEAFTALLAGKSFMAFCPLDHASEPYVVTRAAVAHALSDRLQSDFPYPVSV